MARWVFCRCRCADRGSGMKTDDEPLFQATAMCRGCRTHAVTMVPSASALQTLRKLPPGKASRQDLVAFGDPYFSKSRR